MTNRIGANLDEYGFELYEESAIPIAYLITFRTYGTWLHGDERKSIQRTRDGRFTTVQLDPNVPLKEKMASEMKEPPRLLTTYQRELVEMAIRETCAYRSYGLRAVNVRTNHAHAVVSAATGPNKIVNDLKAYSTRKLRSEGEVDGESKVWSRGASSRYLWKPKFVAAAVEYVLYSQGDVPFDSVFEMPGEE
ncbi:transposase [soil metagenome]